jgi:hypothetical protein
MSMYFCLCYPPEGNIFPQKMCKTNFSLSTEYSEAKRRQEAIQGKGTLSIITGMQIEET